MSVGVKTIIYPVKDLALSKHLFAELLGVEPETDQPYYVGFRVADLDIGLDPNGHRQGLTGPVLYWAVGDIRAKLERLIAAGAECLQDVRDVGWGRLTASVRDPASNVIGLLQNSTAGQTP